MNKIVPLFTLCFILAISFTIQLHARDSKNNNLIQKYIELGELDKFKVLIDSKKQNLTVNELVSRLKNSSALTTAERIVYQDMIRDISSQKASEFIKAIKNNSSVNSLELNSEYLKKSQSTQFLLTEYENFIDFGGGFAFHTLDKYSYDNNLNQILWVSQYYDSTAGWINGSSMIYLYDSFNRDTLDVNQAWDSLSQSWIDYAKWSNTFNSNNDISVSRYFSWADPEWLLGWRYLHTYDANNNTLEMLNQNWADPDWVNSSRQTYTYDANSNLLTDIFSNWDGANWIDFTKRENKYDANNNLISYTFSLFGNYSSKNIYTYDSNNNQISDASYSWDGTKWVIDFKLTSVYDANNNQTEYLVKLSNGSTMEDYLKYDATFNASNQIISWRSYSRKANNWVPNSKGDYTYDADQNNTLYTNYGTRDGGLTWNLFAREAWTWSQAVTGIEGKEDNIAANFSLAQNYPNPFNPSTKISYNHSRKSKC